MAPSSNNFSARFKTFTYNEIKKHCSAQDCWIIESGKVYDITRFLNQHPGGENLILSHAGNDITHYLQDKTIHLHSKSALNLLKDFQIGEVEDNITPSHEEKITNEKTYYDMDVDMSGWNEDLVNWERGMVFQAHKFGKNYFKWVHSPVVKKLRLFDSDFIEFFSKTKWWMIPLIWLPIAIIIQFYSTTRVYQNFVSEFYTSEKKVAYFFSFGFFLLGIPLWSLSEYILHRYLFHMQPSAESWFFITLHFLLHGQHHKVPFDSNRLVFPPVAAGILATPIFFFLNFILPYGLGGCTMAGMLVGYIMYDLIHYYLHHGSPDRGSYMHSLKHYHVLHHFDDHNSGFGISSKVWDYPFSTVNKKLKTK
ncbi:fatty acid 2-hydroxylase isoform X2 [Hydra vulgaris]|uniref:Fatty acid 2-hydroxylase n=1 Tax=Hydra vulgaris TaxID=6087 RepID=A0ABM4DP73_HYDVU